jgi:hypothetical protein
VIPHQTWSRLADGYRQTVVLLYSHGWVSLGTPNPEFDARAVGLTASAKPMGDFESDDQAEMTIWDKGESTTEADGAVRIRA